MALLLQYRNGQLIPVKVDACDLDAVYAQNDQPSRASRANDLMSRAKASVKMYSKLMIMFAAANLIMAVVAVNMMF